MSQLVFWMETDLFSDFQLCGIKPLDLTVGPWKARCDKMMLDTFAVAVQLKVF